MNEQSKREQKEDDENEYEFFHGIENEWSEEIWKKIQDVWN